MKAGNPVVVFNPYEWLPGHGESAVNLYKTGLDLSVEVVYETDDGLSAKIFQFEKVCSVLQCSFPGADLPDVNYGAQSISSIGLLVQYPDSEAAKEWENNFNRVQRIVKHYSIVFLSENMRLVVYAGNVALFEGYYVK